jgi:hypothetical protein
VEDEQNITNYRIFSDYLTSLAQSWVNNLKFFGLDTKHAFLGSQLVLLSRQLSVVADTVDEVRFTLEFRVHRRGRATNSATRVQHRSGDVHRRFAFVDASLCQR